MSLKWEQEILAERIYLPAEGHYGDDKGVPIDEEIQNYIKREFPLPEGDDEVCSYSVPNKFIQHGEDQACKAEEISYQRICNIQLPKNIDNETNNDPLWQSCFQGICYAGRSHRNSREGKIMSKEHDLVVFNIYQGKYYCTLIEVKSTCDDCSMGYVVSDSISVKNNKRSGQHQLRDHLEIIKQTCDIPIENLHCHILWPFLSKWTTDPKGNKVRRWETESDQHAFIDTLSDQQEFNKWFYNSVLCGRSIEKSHFDALFKRFIILSSGIFVNEIHEGMLALLSQQQVSLLYIKPSDDGKPTIVHGAAGTGKTLLVLHKLQFLYENGLLDENNRALYICYWPGIRADFRRKLEALKISDYVDTTRFFIAREDFLQNNRSKYRHIYMDECEAICLAFNESIVSNTFANIETCRKTEYNEDFYITQKNYYRRLNQRTQDLSPEPRPNKVYGDLWYLVDINQATLFIPKFSPAVLKQSHINLSRVIRNTGTIYKVFSQFYKNPLPHVSAAAKLSDLYLNNIDVGHNINGPPIYWVNTQNIPDKITPETIANKTFNGLVRVIIDLYSTKGIKPNDLCVLPFFVTTAYLPDNINKAISTFFVKNGYQPVGITRVEEFLFDCEQNKFLVPWVLRVKGLEFKVVVIAIDQGDFDCSDPEDRRKLYIMASRCTCLLILVSSESVKDAIDAYKVIKAYPFGIKFEC